MDSACPTTNGKILFSLRVSPDDYVLKEVAVEPGTNYPSLPARLIKPWNAPSSFSLSCSSDGSAAASILWRGKPDTYIADINAEQHTLTSIRRLTNGPARNYPHAWTPDSQSVIFEAGRGISYGIFRQSIVQKTVEVIVDTPAQEVLPQLTPDGRWILYASSDGGAPSGIRKLMRISPAGGTPEYVPIGGDLDEFRCPLAGHEGCVLRETKTDREFIYYHLDPVAGKREELIRRKWTPNILGDWDVSPDGRFLAIPSHNPAHPSVMILSLRQADPATQNREIAFQDIGTLWSAVWAADGRGLYLSAKGNPGASLWYSDLTVTLRSCARRELLVLRCHLPMANILPFGRTRPIKTSGSCARSVRI